MYAGSPSRSRSSPNSEGYNRRCSSQLGVAHPDPAKLNSAAYLEPEVWQDCRLNPGETLAETQRQLRERRDQAAAIKAEWEQLQHLLAEGAERERVTALLCCGHLSLSEAGVQFDAVGCETADLRAQIDSLAALAELAKACEARDDWDAKR